MLTWLMFLEKMLFESLLSSSCLQNQLTIKIYVEKLSIVMIHILYTVQYLLYRTPIMIHIQYCIYCTPIMCTPSFWEGLFCVCYRYCDIALFVILINLAYFANNFLKCDQSRKSFPIFPLASGQTTPTLFAVNQCMEYRIQLEYVLKGTKF